MGTGTKVAIGCGCLLLLSAAAVFGVVGWGAWWAKGKLEQASAGLDRMSAVTEEIERFEKQANANAYTPPADGVVPEGRFLKFMGARKQVYAVYERYAARLAEIQKKAESANDKLTLAELWSAGGSLAEMAGAIRLAQMKALASAGMSEAEYRDIQYAVYKSAWAAEAESASGKLPAEAVSESMAEAAKRTEEAVRASAEAARKQGVPGAGQISEADARKLEQGMRQLGERAGEALRVPRENVELFRRHAADIRKYAMHGLAFIGL
jgi:hypothetical protein